MHQFDIADRVRDSVQRALIKLEGEGVDLNTKESYAAVTAALTVLTLQLLSAKMDENGVRGFLNEYMDDKLGEIQATVKKMAKRFDGAFSA
jgi:hypothetical protein